MTIALEPLRRGPAWLGPLAFALSLSVYVPTLAPSVGAGHDSGELATACVVLGIPHPPGYPLYVLVGHLFSYLPVGEEAWRINLFSAVALATGIGFLAAALARRTGPISALSAALVYGFALTPWRQAVVAEVFALHLCLLSALLWLALRWEEATDAERPRLVRWGALVLGLACAHHHTILFALPGLALFGVLARGRGRRWGFGVPAALILATAAMTPYALLALRSLQDPPMDWGDPSNPARMVAHVLRRAYGSSFALNVFSGQGEPTWPIHLRTYAVSLVRDQFPFLAFLLAVVGLVWAWCTERAAAILLTGWIVVSGPAFAVMGNQPDTPFFADVLERFYASSYLGWAGFVAFGLAPIERWITASRLTRARALLLLLPAVSLVLNWPRASLAGQFHPVDYVAAVHDAAPAGAMLVIGGDLSVGVSDYLRLVRGQRTDLIVIKPGLVGTAWYQAQLPAELAAAARPAQGRMTPSLAAVMQRFREGGGEVYLNYSEPYVAGQYLRRGLAWRYLLPDEAPPTAEDELAAAAATLESMERQPRRGDYRDHPRRGFWDRYYISHWVDAYRTLAAPLSAVDPERAAVAVERVVEMSPRALDDWIHLGWLRLALGQWTRAEEAFRRAEKLAPGDLDVTTGLAQLRRAKATAATPPP